MQGAVMIWIQLCTSLLASAHRKVHAPRCLHNYLHVLQHSCRGVEGLHFIFQLPTVTWGLQYRNHSSLDHPTSCPLFHIIATTTRGLATVMGDSMATSIMDFVLRYREYEGYRDATHDFIRVSRVAFLSHPTSPVRLLTVLSSNSAGLFVAIC